MVGARGAGRLALCAIALAACSGQGAGGQAGGGQVAPPLDGSDGGTGAAPDGGSGPATSAPPDAGPTAPPDAGPGASSLAPPFTKGGWTFYGTAQGLSADISDVSADEGGNVYVAGGDAVYAKKRGDPAFLRFDAANAGLTRNCYAGVNGDDPSQLDGKLHPTPPGPAVLCPVVSVAGAAPGQAAVGFRGLGTDGDLDADWAQDGGGMDLVQFDGTALTRTRHVFIASPPQTICVMPDASGQLRENFATSCPNPPDPFFWQVGRRKLRQVDRIVVNHDPGSPMYGDMFMGGTHASITVLVANAAARGWVDNTVGQPAKWADAKDVWEHDHPAFYTALTNQYLTGETHALAVDPRSGTPWCSNGVRTGWLTGYGADVSSKVWWLEPQTAANPLWYDWWPDGTANPVDPAVDDLVESLSFCDDGTLWIGSAGHGLVRRDPGGGTSYLDLPDPASHGNNALAVACDPSDRSVWIGLGWGGVMRLKNGSFTLLDPNDTSLPAFSRQPVRSIQIDRWASPRVVYFAFEPSKDASGNILKGGGVAAYAGP